MVNKQKLLMAAFGMLLLALTLTGYAQSGASPDVYYSTYTTDVTILKQYYVPDTTGKKVIANVMDGLIENDRFGFYAPSLAESWTHSDDFTVWTFQLRKGAMWVDHSGKAREEVTAQDFVDGLRYVADPKKTKADVSIIKNVIVGLADYIGLLQDYDKNRKGAREDVEKKFDELVGVKAIDRYRVQYVLASPTPFFESFLVTEIFLPLNQKFVLEAGIRYGTSKEYLLYNGAYYLDTWQRNKEFVLVKNPHYYDKDKIAIQKVALQKVADSATNIEMFKRGQLTSVSLAGNQIAFYMDNPKWKDFINLSEKSSVVFWFFPNFRSKNAEFSAFIQQESFRKALYHAIDRLILAQIYNSYDAEEMLINTILPDDVIFDEKGNDYTSALQDLKDLGKGTYQPELARAYFQSAREALVDAKGMIKGVKPGKVKIGSLVELDIDAKLPIQLVYTHGTSTDETQMALLLKANLEQVFGKENLRVVLAQYTNNKYETVILPGYYDLCYDSFSFKYADPFAQLGRLVTGGEVNDGGFSVPEFDALVAEASSKILLSERYQLFAKAERLLIEGGYILPWESGGGTYGMSKEKPFTAPRGGFGLSRFKYKGIVLQNDPVTKDEFEKLKTEYLKELEERKSIFNQ